MAEVTTSASTDLPADAMTLQSLTRPVAGPPYEVTFEVAHTNSWPACLLVVRVGGQPVLVAQTDEPRVKSLAAWLLEETS